jgi:hypothetical protein
MVTLEVLGGVLTLTEWLVGWLHKDPSSNGPSVFAVGTGIPHSHQHRVRDLTRSWQLALSKHVSNNDCVIAELKLGPMALANLHTGRRIRMLRPAKPPLLEHLSTSILESRRIRCDDPLAPDHELLDRLSQPASSVTSTPMRSDPTRGAENGLTMDSNASGSPGTSQYGQRDWLAGRPPVSWWPPRVSARRRR